MGKYLKHWGEDNWLGLRKLCMMVNSLQKLIIMVFCLRKQSYWQLFKEKIN